MDPETDRRLSEPHVREQRYETRQAREHQGATEEKMIPTPPPADPEYDDEPRQG
jgi:hypothetical protein